MEFHFLFFLISSISFVSESISLSEASYTDAQHLISFKSALGNPNLLQNWEPNQNPCDFAGVSCKNSRVSDIDLSFFNLEADFQLVSSFLMSLKNLERLSLRFTNLTGNLSVDSGFRCSEVLFELNLAGNGLIGSISEISSLRSCSSLKTLDLSNNQLGFSNFEDSAGFLLNLKNFNLSFNLISGQNVLSWLLSGGCSELKYLDLAGNEISGDIPVSDCGSLEFLNLSSNNFSGEIPSFGDCLSLQTLDLSDNRFSGEFGGRISGCKGLKSLNLSTNDLSGNIPAFPCGNLIHLDLSFNHLAGNLPYNLSSCSILESFNVSNNNISGQFQAETLISMSNLKRLVLSYNDFNGSLPNSVSKLINLELLDLSSNSLHSSLPSELCRNPKNSLKELYLQNNLFFGTIPATLSNCSKLISLDLSFNYLTGTIPSSLGSLTQLRDLIMWLNQLEGEIPEQLMNVRNLENLILDNNKLTGSIPSGLSNCTILNWISLSSNLLSGDIPSWIGRLSNLAILKLGNNSFSGEIPPELGECKSLIWLDLNSNQLTGSIPPSLAKQSGKIAVGLVTGKRYVYMKNDGSTDCRGAGNLLEFAGIREERLNRVPTRHSCNFTRVYIGNTKYTFNNNGSMIFLDLSYNQLVGEIPKELGKMFHLSVLNLGHNSLSGFVPFDLGSLKNVGILDLSHNNLKGPIPNSFSGLSFLIEIDLSNNNLTGSIPGSGQLWTFPAYRYMNNSGLCGYPLPPCQRYSSDSNTLLNSNHRKSHRKQASVAGSVAMGLLLALFCIFGFVIITVEKKKRKNKKKKKRNSSVEINTGSRSHSGTGSIDWKLMGKKEALSINLATFEKPLLNLTFADLLEATNGFDNSSLVGSGGFGDVYKAELKDGTTVAIKKLIHVSGQGDREFMAEMETIGKIKHHNLVPLLGYCRVGEERLLVYEFMKFGSLDDVLHDRRKAGIKLDWPARRKIAWGAAKGLAFLHHKCIPHIIHRDMKSSNVLVDKNLEARVSDFGMARLVNAVDTHLSVSTLAGTPGYVPPEYYQSFRCSTKGDVYSFGVVLLELLTGKQPTDSSDFGENNLVGWVKQHAKLKISDVFDPMLMREDPNLEIELLRHLKIACVCLDDQPWRRPTMRDVMGMFKEIQAASGVGDTNGSDDESFGMAKVAEVSPKEGKEEREKQ